MRQLIGDLPKYDQSRNIREVWNARTFDKQNPTKGGLYDPEIFDDEHSSLGFIKIPRIMQPLVFMNAGAIHSTFNQAIQLKDKKKKKFIVNEQGRLEESESGKRGVNWLYEVWDKLDLESYINEKNKVFLKHLIEIGKNGVFINRVHVAPIVVRPFTIKNGMVSVDPLTELYSSLLAMNRKNKGEISSFLGNVGGTVNFYQLKVNEIYDHILNLMDGKKGLYRNLLTGHRVDTNATMVANTNPNVPVNAVVIPWHYMLVLWDTFLLGYFLRPENESKREALGLGNLTNAKEFGDLVLHIQKNVNEYTSQQGGETLKNVWIESLAELNDEYKFAGIYLRNPTFDKLGFVFVDIVIMETSNEASMVINSNVAGGLGLDNDGDLITFQTALTEEAKQSLKDFGAKSLNFWIDLIDGSLRPTIADGALTGLFTGTRVK